MNVIEAEAVLKAVFAPYSHIQLNDDLREAWYEVALRDCDYLAGMRIARALASTCDFPPVPKQFLEMRRAAMLPERETRKLTSGGPEQANDNGRVWIRHLSMMMKTIGTGGKAVDLGGHTKIEGDSWATCPACRAYSKELATSGGIASGDQPW